MTMAANVMAGPGEMPESRSRGDCLGSLSPREREVLKLIAEGYRDRDIAERLFLSHHTVANHARNILGKLGVSSRAAAILLAVRGDLI